MIESVKLVRGWQLQRGRTLRAPGPPKRRPHPLAPSRTSRKVGPPLLEVLGGEVLLFNQFLVGKNSSPRCGGSNEATTTRCPYGRARDPAAGKGNCTGVPVGHTAVSVGRSLGARCSPYGSELLPGHADVADRDSGDVRCVDLHNPRVTLAARTGHARTLRRRVAAVRRNEAPWSLRTSPPPLRRGRSAR